MEPSNKNTSCNVRCIVWNIRIVIAYQVDINWYHWLIGRWEMQFNLKGFYLNQWSLPLSEPMLPRFSDAIWHHYGPMS